MLWPASASRRVGVFHHPRSSVVDHCASFDWDGDETDAPKEPSKVTPAESTKPAKPSSKANVKPVSAVLTRAFCT